MKFITLKHFPTQASVDHITNELRGTFADVFARAYTQRLAPVLMQAIDQKTYSNAAELKACPEPILQGFSDLLVKKQFFSQPLAFYRRANEIYKVFHRI